MLRTAAYHYELSFAWWYDSSKNSKQINLTLKASIKDHLNVASFHLLFLVQQTIAMWADKRYVFSKAAENLEGGC